MEPQRPHQRFTRPPSYGGPSPDPRNHQPPPPPPPPRPSFGPSTSSLPGRSQPPYDPFRRAESEMQQTRPHPFSYPMSQHHTKPESPVPYASSSHPESVSAFHSRHSSHDSIKQHHDGGGKDYNTLYREGHSHQLPRDVPHMSHINDQSRRQSLGSSGSPPLYPPGSHDHPPSSHSYGNRQMLPPVSPPRYQPHGASAPPPPPPPPSQPSMTPRETPLSGHRPGSSMSISSVLGSDADRPSQDSRSSSGYIRSSIPATSIATGQPSTGGAMSPPTAPARHTSEYSPYQGSNASEKPPISKPQPPRQYRSSSGGIPQAQVPSESSRIGGPLHTQSYSPYGDKPPTDRSPSAQYSDTSYNQTRRLSLNGPIQRPNSQPPPEEYPPKPHLFSPLSRPSQPTGDTHLNGSQRPGPRYPTADTQPQHRYGGPPQERPPQDVANRDREVSGSQDTAPKPYQPQPQSRLVSQLQEREPEKPRMPWDSMRSQPASPESKRGSTTDAGQSFGFNSAQDYNNKSHSPQPGTRAPSSMPIQARQEQRTPSNEGSFLNNALNKLQNQSRGLLSFTSAPSGNQQSFGSSASGEEQQRKGSDELLHHRNLLNINAENKRTGRLSPLPQAVQGAQAQLVGPTGEPGIKNELGRVFSGIGSGVGVSAPGQVGSGPPTPVTSSPFKRDDGMARSASGGLNESTIPKVPRAGSGAGKRGRKPKDEENKDGAENGAPRGPGTRGGRRGRHVHHHHHHGHHHHHHRRKLEDEANDGTQPRSAALSTPNFPRTAAPSDNAGAPPAATSHHHHHHHHHHHVPRTSSAVNNSLAPPPPREHNKVVNLQPLLKSVSHLPRHHLGSTLYCPKIDVPTANATPESAKFGYASTPVPIPRFEGKENCTFTIRVPRFRLDRSHREEICARRALWGTGVYTDDSDPVAAVIHSGYIRGEWDDDVDLSMLDLEIKEQYQHAPRLLALNGTSLAAKSQQDGNDLKRDTKIPPVPPADKDLHITLLILPPLEKYDSTVLFGLKSREWGDNHDGMSFKVERIDWVDEGVAKGEERGGEARRKRLRSMMNTGRICTGAGLKGKGGVELRQRKMAMGIGNNGPSGDDSKVSKAVETAS